MSVHQLPYAIDENNPEYSLYLNKALYNFRMMVPDFMVLIHANLSIGRNSYVLAVYLSPDKIIR
ncbi:hypothetical protein [Snodgrassella sp.]|uniref:hypothetical protein n=1 Tax=Snodgrassella sp. TaxID=2815304 RepID=UPI0025851CE6|nr:hypothetical protein [Snodgrassella sp.]MCO6518123.1 hypothetical protein [Snodgrassella sp.]